MKDDFQLENHPYAEQLAALPIFAQTLVACRLSRRAALAIFEGAESAIAQSVCNVIESICEGGREALYDDSALNAIAGISTTSKNRAAMNALQLTIDAIKLASKSGDTSAERVAAIVGECIEPIRTDPHFASLQVAIILKGDMDLIRFACAEANINTDQGVSGYVINRLTPCHALSVFEPRLPIEDEYR